MKLNKSELVKSKEYWVEKIQNELYDEVQGYMIDNDLNRSQFAKKLGISKSYISQVLNGSFDHKLSKLVEICLAIDKVPEINFVNIDNYLKTIEVNDFVTVRPPKEKYNWEFVAESLVVTALPYTIPSKGAEKRDVKRYIRGGEVFIVGEQIAHSFIQKSRLK